MRRWIKVNTQFYGLHEWKDCNIREVEFLKNLHRHKFLVTVRISTDVLKDREIEFYDFKNNIDDIIVILYGDENLKLLEGRSCEKISDEIFSELKKVYQHNKINIEVSEDGQASSYTEYD